MALNNKRQIFAASSIAFIVAIVIIVSAFVYLPSQGIQGNVSDGTTTTSSGYSVTTTANSPTNASSPTTDQSPTETSTGSIGSTGSSTTSSSSILSCSTVSPSNSSSTSTSAVLTYAGGDDSASSTTTIIIPNGAGVNTSLNFQPSNITVVIGVNNTITWVDQDATIQNVVFTNAPNCQSLPAPSQLMSNGGTFTVTLTTPGVYEYVSQYHSPWMHGTITVEIGT